MATALAGCVESSMYRWCVMVDVARTERAMDGPSEPARAHRFAGWRAREVKAYPPKNLF